MTHIRLAATNEDMLTGALHAAWKLRVQKNAKPTTAARKKKTAKPRRLPK